MTFRLGLMVTDLVGCRLALPNHPSQTLIKYFSLHAKDFFLDAKNTFHKKN
jgi:hypothetical protein